MQNHNDDTIIDKRHSSLEKYTSHFIWKGCVWEGVGDRTELQHIDPHSYDHQRFFSVVQGCSTGGRGPSLSECWFSLPQLSPTRLVSKLTDFLSSPSYIIVCRPPSSCGRHNFAFIQPVHGQGYNILIIPRPDVPVIYTGAFLILTARAGRRSIYNTRNSKVSLCGLLAKVLECEIVVCKFELQFTFELIPLSKVWVKSYHYSSFTRIRH